MAADLGASSSLEEGIALFLEYLHKERHCAPHTLQAYAHDLKQFVRFLYPRVRDLRLPLRAVQRQAVRAYLEDLQARGLKKSSVARKLAALRSLFRYLCRQGVLAANPASGVAAPRVERRRPPQLELEQVEQALALPALERFTGIRDRAILEVFYGGGLRLGELVGLNLSSLDLEEGTLRLKGRAERLAPIGAPAVETLRAYLRRRAEVLLELDIAQVDAGALFLNGRGRRLSRRSVQHIVERYLSQVAQGEGLSPHLLRHTFAAHLLDAGADLVAVKELLGHAVLASTQVYTQVSLERLLRVYGQAHPRS
jgi:integrase/recombinase XerC